MKKLDDKTVNAIAHNIIIDQVLNVAWDFVCSLAPTNEFDYAHVNSATEDYCDTSWHVTQNVTLHQSLDLIDAKDMYDNAWDNYNMLLDTNTQKLSASSIFKQLDDISGDTAMRDNYYSLPTVIVMSTVLTKTSTMSIRSLTHTLHNKNVH